MKTEFRYKYFVFACLAAVAFFNPMAIFSDQTKKLILYIAIVGGLAVLMLKGFRTSFKTFPKVPYFLLYLGFFTSFLASFTLHNQSIKTSFIAEMSCAISYLSLPLMYYLKPTEQQIIKTFWVLVLISGCVYIINFVTFPNVLFGTTKATEINDSRGFNRITVPNIATMVLLLFYFLNQISLQPKAKNGKRWFRAFLMYAFIILSLTRQIIFLSSLLGTWLFLKGKGSAAKFFLSILIASFVVVVIPQIPLYQKLQAVTERDTGDGIENNIRFKAWEFYTIDYQTNWLTPIIGNGVPALESSPWGKAVDAKTNGDYGGNGCYPGDVGWAGFFWNYGAIATIGLICIFFKAIRKPKIQSQRYITYWLIFIVITSVASAPILYIQQIFFVCVGLYMAYQLTQKPKNHSSNYLSSSGN